MRWLNLIANLLILSWIGYELGRDGDQVVDAIGFCAWGFVCAWETHRDFFAEDA